MKLNLGSGIYYKPGYINIDIDEQSVADEKFDIVRLPYDSNSIEEIEASHILEHFDILWLPFILAEWFRVLKPEGVIYIETPHLTKNTRRLQFQSYERKKNTIRFLYGIDVHENFHKIGFTTRFLKKSLKNTGFKNVRKVKQKSFLKNKSIRIRAIKKPDSRSFSRVSIITAFRQKILANFVDVDSYFFETIEINCILPLQKILAKNAQNFVQLETVGFFASSFAIIHPKLSKLFLEIFPKEISKKLNVKFLDYLEDIKSPSLFLTNWILRKKGDAIFKLSFSEFNSYWIKQIYSNLINKVEIDRFDYFSSREIKEVEFFSYEMLNRETLLLFNLGIKAFANNELSDAEEYLKNSLKYLPTYNLTFWNLARVSILLNDKKMNTTRFYDSALKHTKERKLRKIIQTEKKEFLDESVDKKDITPLQMRK